MKRDLPHDPAGIALTGPADEGIRFKQSMRQLAGAVSVVTVGRGGQRTGFTATSVIALSLAPPSILLSVGRSASSLPRLEENGTFVVNVLSQGQQHIADRFSGREGLKGAERYEGVQWSESPGGGLSLPGAVLVLNCELEEVIVRHSHAIVIARVRSSWNPGGGEPLLYWEGGYRGLTEKAH